MSIPAKCLNYSAFLRVTTGLSGLDLSTDSISLTSVSVLS